MALVSHGFKSKTDRTRPVDEADVRATFDSITPQEAAEPTNSALFYPADRGSIVFPEEPAVAIVARKYGCSLIVICPFMRADKMGYNHFYNIKNRPPMYARWSTGQQAQAMPLVLGCLPMHKFNTSPSYEAMWFYIEANSIDPPDWYNGFYTQFNLGSLADNLGFPFAELSPQTFLWTLVYLHRQRMTGLAVPDDHLGCWIYHFGWHLSVEGKRVNKYSDLLPFNYDNAWLSDYQRKHPNAKLTFDRLTQLTLNPNMNANGISIGQYARLWDEAFSARIQYQQDQTQAKWVVFKTKMEAATELPHLWNS
ncbi:hypothetical protein J4E93_009573 [Alternaria ventricosa]|uniref:uncharacterized protein n=1 Tax=Alternaria ventricosa TaxID=1187951 RepID=UPI0020C598B8|nr:uncharacterized protein J4E93_009573 [Alternaria ventricosa]KAI4639083.1 hypothetical protein J4E93_009573 [Alternaria ventricosa]